MNQIFSEILGIHPDADPQEIKQAYRRLARENHPDHFVPALRPLQELRMMQINEAYEYLWRHSQHSEQQSRPDGIQNTSRPKYDIFQNTQVDASTKDVAGPKDPAYAYYRQGFNEYSRGVGGMMLRGTAKITPDASGLRRTIQALEHFQSAYRYFQQVVQDYPESIWQSDARYRLKRLERFRAVYKRIQQNLKAKKVEPTIKDKSPNCQAEPSSEDSLVDDLEKEFGNWDAD